MGFEMTNGGQTEGPDLTNESRSLSLVDLQDSTSDGLDDSQWQRRTGLLPLSFQNPVYHMSTTSARQQTDATPSDGSVGSQGNAEDRSTMATKPAFLTQMSVGLGGADRGERGERMSAMSSSSSGEEYSKRALSLSETLPGMTRGLVDDVTDRCHLHCYTYWSSLEEMDCILAGSDSVTFETAISIINCPELAHLMTSLFLLLPQVALPPHVRTPQVLNDALTSLLLLPLPHQDLLEVGHLPAC